MSTAGTNLPSGGILQALHDSEINATVSVFFDGCFTARLGDRMNGWEAEETLPTMVDAEAWLDRKARELHPQSAYAKRQTTP
jgi:hypothetical protein